MTMSARDAARQAAAIAAHKSWCTRGGPVDEGKARLEMYRFARAVKSA